MNSFLCVCGERIHTCVIPHSDGYYLVPETLFGQLCSEKVARDAEARIAKEITQVYKCVHCGRLRVLWQNDSSTPTFYQAVDGPDKSAETREA